MGILDLLKKLMPEGEPPPAMEPQCVRHKYLTIRLPVGWRFLSADPRKFEASGPGGASAEFYISHVYEGRRLMKAEEVEQRREEIRKIHRMLLGSNSAQEEVLPGGALWMEAGDTQGESQRLQIVVLNPKPRAAEIPSPPSVHVICKMPGASAGGGFSAERFEALRAAVRSLEWN